MNVSRTGKVTRGLAAEVYDAAALTREVTATDPEHLENTEPVLCRVAAGQDCREHSLCSASAPALAPWCSPDPRGCPTAPGHCDPHGPRQQQSPGAAAPPDLSLLCRCSAHPREKQRDMAPKVPLLKGHIRVNNLFKLWEQECYVLGKKEERSACFHGYSFNPILYWTCLIVWAFKYPSLLLLIQECNDLLET